jgi:hypothetical protein
MKQQIARTTETVLAGFFNPVLQLFRSRALLHYRFILLLVVPIIFLIAVNTAHYSRGPFYLWSVDPEYFYMYNGVILGAGNLSIQYYAHPGTPLHYIIAISARITDLFHEGDYMENFVNDPEKYIHAANLFLIILITIVIYISGRYTLKYTGSFPAAILMQLSPFASHTILGMSGRLIPEAVMIIPLMLLTIMILKCIYEDKDVRKTRQNLVLFGMIIGFGIACKLTFLPLIVLPLFLLKTNAREKILSVMYTLLFFVIFAYPLVFNVQDSWKWISGIIAHTGKYGTGDTGFIDFSRFSANFRELFIFNRTFFIIMLFSLVLSLLPLIINSKNIDNRGMIISRSIFSLTIAILLCAFAILKHYKLYYFMPLTVFTFLFILLDMMLIFRFKPIQDRKLLKGLIMFVSVIAVSIIIVREIAYFRTFISISEEKNRIRMNTATNILSMVDREKPLILTGPYYGTPFIEFAQVSGFIMSDNLKGFYTAYLKEKYPHFYKYADWTERFYFWDDLIDIEQIIADQSSLFIYIGQGMSNDLAVIEQRINQSASDKIIAKSLRYIDEETGEQLIEMSFKNAP